MYSFRVRLLNSISSWSSPSNEIRIKLEDKNKKCQKGIVNKNKNQQTKNKNEI